MFNSNIIPDEALEDYFKLLEEEEMEDKMFWLKGFKGPAKGGLYVRSEIAIEVAEYEEKFGIKIVALGLEKDDETNKPSWNLNLVTEMVEGDKYYEKAMEIKDKKTV